MRDSTVLLLRPYSMDLGIFHEIWDHERYTAGSISVVARHGTIVDIGAHIGLFSLFASKVLQANRIISVEPDSANFEPLSKNISANHVENASLVKAAIAGESGEKRIYNTSSNTGGHTPYPPGVSSTAVRTGSLTQFFQGSSISDCSLLQMDCQGAEVEVPE